MPACRFGLALTLLLLAGCQHETPPTKSPALSSGIFEDKDHGFSVKLPEKWRTKENRDPQDVLTLSGPQGAELAIAVPRLPPHIPGIIPLPGVENGYVEDVKKRMPDVTATESTPVKVAGAFARKFALAGIENGNERKLLVLAIVKGDTLYIVTGEGPADQFEAVKTAVEEIEKSWTWNK